MQEKIKILLVEDDKLSQKIANIILVEENCSVDCVDTGIEALNKLNSNCYDIVFLDLGLPDIDGFNIAKSTRSSDTCNNNVFIVALTAHSNALLKKKSEEHGIDAFIVKPLMVDNAKKLLQDFPSRKRNCINC